MADKKTICAEVLVKNEERFIWFSVMSVIDFVDKILIYDTGSTDNTPKIIDKIRKKYPSKIELHEVGGVDPSGFTKIRQEMLETAKNDWVLILDGDEVWWNDSLKKILQIIDNDNKVDAIVSPFINVVGDVFHYQEKMAGRYRIDGRTGNLTIRAFRKDIKNLHLSRDYGQEGFVDSTGEFIQESGEVKRRFVDGPFLHLTHLKRSSKDIEVMQRDSKLKYELGIPFPEDYYFPEVFFEERPDLVESPWQSMKNGFKFRAFFETPLRKIKRRVWWGKPGY